MKILMLMMEAGSGHKAPAMALKQNIEETYPGQHEIEVIDFAKVLECTKFDSFYKNTWNFFLKKPFLFSLTYSIVNTRFAKLNESIITRKVTDKVEGFIKGFKPDIIVSTHFTSSNILAKLTEKKKINLPCVAIITDPFNKHRIWVNKNNFNVVFSENAKKYLISKGIVGSHVKHFSFPLRAPFSKKLPSKEELRTKLGFGKDKFVFFISSGGEGIGNMEVTVKKLLAAKINNLQIVVVAGRNQNLYENLKSLNAGSDLKIFGYVNNMEEILKASDLICGKTGASFTFEALSLGKPLLFNQTIANEFPTRDAIVNGGMAWYVPKPNQIVSFVKKITKDKSELNRVANNVKKFNFKSGTSEIAQYILNLIH